MFHIFCGFYLMAASNLIKNRKALFKILKFLNVSVLAIYNH